MMSMTDQEKMLNKKIQIAIKEKSFIKGLDLRANLPFTVTIMNYECPTKFKPSNLDPYDGTKDPPIHVLSFKSHTIFLGASNEMMCRSFLLTFKNATWNWYSTLKLKSISYFVEFV